MLFGQSIGAIAKLRAMLPFLGALLFCAAALRKIKTARAHKAKALDLALGPEGVNSGAKGFPHVIALCPAWRWRSSRDLKKLDSAATKQSPTQ